jgi:hypothetical protein
MVAPVFGPFAEEKIHSRVLHTDRLWYRQGKPYRDPLPWRSTRKILVRESTPGAANSAGDALALQSSAYIRATNKCYENLISKLGDSSMWAVNLAEQKQSMSMIVNRLNQIRLFTYHLRRAQFPAAARAIKLAVVPHGVSKAKAFGNNFLEYHFGWEPLLKDIHAGVESFLNPHLPGKRAISGRGSAVGDTFVPPIPVIFVSGYATTETAKVRMGAAIAVDNPNLHLASQLGLVNPLSVAWELVPFSFVVDWFANVGQVLSSYTDFAGCTLSGAYTTSLGICQSRRLYYWGDFADFLHVQASRGLGITGPQLVVKPFVGLSPVRGITAVSLLLQQLRR